MASTFSDVSFASTGALSSFLSWLLAILMKMVPWVEAVQTRRYGTHREVRIASTLPAAPREAAWVVAGFSTPFAGAVAARAWPAGACGWLR